MNRIKKPLLDVVRILAGLAVFALGVHFTIHADIGVAPWDCLGFGIAAHTPLSYGLSMTSIAVVVLAIDIAMGERIGFGTIIDALVTGNLVDLFNRVDPLPANNGAAKIPLGIAFIAGGLVLMALGQAIYMKAGQCCGPRDSLLVGLGKRLHRLPIGAVEILLWGVVLLAGWLLGGPVGIGTLVTTFGGGVVMQLVYKLIRFEPRAVRHRGVIETVREWRGK